MDSEVTIEEAARLLHVSRTFVISLVTQGSLPCAHASEGRHHRIPLVSVLAYKNEMKKNQEAGLRDMIAASENAGLYESELRNVPVRRRR